MIPLSEPSRVGADRPGMPPESPREPGATREGGTTIATIDDAAPTMGGVSQGFNSRGGR